MSGQHAEPSRLGIPLFQLRLQRFEFGCRFRQRFLTVLHRRLRSPVQQLQWAVEMFRLRRTAFYPVAIIAVKHAVDVAQFLHGE